MAIFIFLAIFISTLLIVAIAMLGVLAAVRALDYFERGEFARFAGCIAVTAFSVALGVTVVPAVYVGLGGK